MDRVFWPVYHINCQQSRGASDVWDRWRQTFSPASKSCFWHLAQLEWRTRLFCVRFERLQRSYPTREGLSCNSPPLEGRFILRSVTHAVIEAATGTGAAGGLDVFPHSCRSKHVKLDLCPRIHPDPWLIVYLPVLLPELRFQMDEVVGGPVAPDPLSMCKAKLFSQGILDKLHNGQPQRSERRRRWKPPRTNICDGKGRGGRMVGLCLRQPAVKSFQYWRTVFSPALGSL